MVKQKEMSMWADRLQMAILAETSGAQARMESSSLELLLEASIRVPRMLVIGQRGFSERHPVAALVFFVVTMWMLSSGLAIATLSDLPLQAAILILAIGVLACEWYAYLRLARADRQRLERSIEDWNRRQALLQRAFDDVLGRG
jgi:hypothetical protein